MLVYTPRTHTYSPAFADRGVVVGTQVTRDVCVSGEGIGGGTCVPAPFCTLIGATVSQLDFDWSISAPPSTLIGLPKSPRGLAHSCKPNPGPLTHVHSLKTHTCPEHKPRDWGGGGGEVFSDVLKKILFFIFFFFFFKAVMLPRHVSLQMLCSAARTPLTLN